MWTVDNENECTNSTAALGKTCAAPTSLIIKTDFKDARERLDHLFINTTAWKKADTGMFSVYIFFFFTAA